jgi:pantoate--beta-alanine ligase
MKALGFVPTMGALHEGHLSLVRQALLECERVIVSIFVNPSQFAPGEDYDAYPRTEVADRALLASLDGADRVEVFIPSVADVYPDGFVGSTQVVVPGLSFLYCGASRPDFLVGAASVVLRFLNMLRPDCIYFGEKDYQQCCVMAKMVADLHIPVKVVVCPLIRELNGLALSSRNRYLSESQQQQASHIYAVLSRYERNGALFAADGGVAGISTRIAAGGIQVDYVVLVGAQFLEEKEIAVPGDRLLFAGYVNQTRLIDTVKIGPFSV